MGYSWAFQGTVMTTSALSALQDMLKTCQDFAAAHKLRFSTDTNPTKCKTKTMAFLKTPRILPNLTLCGNPIPWTEKCKHLGTTLTNTIDGCEDDIRIKNAMYVEKNPTTKLAVNKI